MTFLRPPVIPAKAGIQVICNISLYPNLLSNCAVLGNHDFWSGQEVAEKIARGLEGVGVRILRNEAVPIEKKLLTYSPPFSNVRLILQMIITG